LKPNMAASILEIQAMDAETCTIQPRSFIELSYAPGIMKDGSC
jgi:hypothetical protein